MKAFTIILIVAIIYHQTTVETVNSILAMELVGLVLFWFFGRRYFKERRRSIETRSHLKGFKKSYSTKENKPWRDYRSNVDVQPEKTSFKELIQ